jgi:hypothetical protein
VSRGDSSDVRGRSAAAAPLSLEVTSNTPDAGFWGQGGRAMAHAGGDLIRLAILLLSVPPDVFAADPACKTGIPMHHACCAESCGRCGGPSCGSLPGGSDSCCTGSIMHGADSCNNYDPPCVIHPTRPPTACGDYPAPLMSDRPNVLLIGDSISMPVPFTPGGSVRV